MVDWEAWKVWPQCWLKQAQTVGKGAGEVLICDMSVPHDQPGCSISFTDCCELHNSLPVQSLSDWQAPVTK